MSLTSRRLLVLVTLASLALTEGLGSHSPVRILPGLLLALALPGLAWYSATGRGTSADRVIQAIGTLSISLAVTILCGLCLGAVGAATATAIAAAVGGVTLVLAVGGALR